MHGGRVDLSLCVLHVLCCACAVSTQLHLKNIVVSALLDNVTDLDAARKEYLLHVKRGSDYDDDGVDSWKVSYA